MLIDNSRGQVRNEPNPFLLVMTHANRLPYLVQQSQGRLAPVHNALSGICVFHMLRLRPGFASILPRPGTPSDSSGNCLLVRIL